MADHRLQPARFPALVRASPRDSRLTAPRLDPGDRYRVPDTPGTSDQQRASGSFVERRPRAVSPRSQTPNGRSPITVQHRIDACDAFPQVTLTSGTMLT